MSETIVNSVRTCQNKDRTSLLEFIRMEFGITNVGRQTTVYVPTYSKATRQCRFDIFFLTQEIIKNPYRLKECNLTHLSTHHSTPKKWPGGVNTPHSIFNRHEILFPALPYGQFPLYEENGRRLNQSIAIARYVAVKSNLLPSDPWEQAVLDASVLNIFDFWSSEYRATEQSNSFFCEIC